ncbi:MAG: hypothetical protein KF799_04865 [Bdellovibrionales bacterium]|nr:hypothetical protein [Bdellovibrionales bacterium]
MFQSNKERVQQIFTDLHFLQSQTRPFEERFIVVHLDYAIEDLLEGRECDYGSYLYCFYINSRGIRHLRINETQSQIAGKIKAQQPLSSSEKVEALHMLRSLSF